MKDGTYFKPLPLPFRKIQFWGEVTKEESTNRRLKLAIQSVSTIALYTLKITRMASPPSGDFSGGTGKSSTSPKICKIWGFFVFKFWNLWGL